MNVLEKEEYRAKLADLTDEELVKEAENYAWLSAYANNNPRSEYHSKCDATYDEAQRRGKPWLYQRGWNAAYRSCGYEPTESDLERARAPASAMSAGTAETPQEAQVRSTASAVAEGETPNPSSTGENP